MRANRWFGRLTMLALVAVAAACSRETPSGLNGPLASAVQGRAGWRFNSQKYRDAGAHAWTGRSGSAAISAEALIAPSGAVTLVVTSFRAVDLSTPAGKLDKVQVKIFSSTGLLLKTMNVSGLSGTTWTTPLAGLPAGGTVQVQANVSGIDGRRTDVVTISGIVAVIAPDLAVTGLVLPSTAITGVPTVLAATIAELGGQHGARANCVLYVDGVFADRSANIWVDAGDQVSCAFTRTFTLPGSPVIRVTLEAIQPADGDASNNSASGALHVVAPIVGGTAPTFDGYVKSGTINNADTFETRWTDPSGQLFLDQRSGSLTTGTQFAFSVTGTIPTTVSFPVTRLEIAENGDGHLLTSARFDNVPATSVSPGATCAALDAGAGANIYFCSYSLGFTIANLVHMAGTVTYQSTDYSKIWNGSSYDENTYVVNDTTTTGVFADVRSTFSINLQVTDGSVLYVMNGATTMNPVTNALVDPRQCVDQPIAIPPVTYDTHTCFASSYVFTGFEGILSGTGLSALP